VEVLNHVAELLAKRSEGFLRAEIMDQGRAVHGVSKEDNDITREVHDIKHFTAQAIATMESATRTKGKKLIHTDELSRQRIQTGYFCRASVENSN